MPGRQRPRILSRGARKRDTKRFRSRSSVQAGGCRTVQHCGSVLSAPPHHPGAQEGPHRSPDGPAPEATTGPCGRHRGVCGGAAARAKRRGRKGILLAVVVLLQTGETQVVVDGRLLLRRGDSGVAATLRRFRHGRALAIDQGVDAVARQVQMSDQHQQKEKVRQHPPLSNGLGRQGSPGKPRHARREGELLGVRGAGEGQRDLRLLRPVALVGGLSAHVHFDAIQQPADGREHLAQQGRHYLRSLPRQHSRDEQHPERH
mmetsp:Transcript_32155/g.75631  ORF Transcript_32155/g.75631 Transcript_32155/m.75631 type:complete len:260 (-) Transcript_32155:2445-3224(-)